MMLFGAMNLASSWTVTDDTAAGKVKNLSLSLNQNILLKYMFGISKKGPTGICIFEGIMDAPFFCQILR